MPTNRVNRAVLAKAGDALDVKNAKIVYLKDKIVGLERWMEALKPRTKKKVREDANDRFTSLANIVEAQEASERPPKRRRRARQKDSAPVVEQVHEMITVAV